MDGVTLGCRTGCSGHQQDLYLVWKIPAPAEVMDAEPSSLAANLGDNRKQSPADRVDPQGRELVREERKAKSSQLTMGKWGFNRALLSHPRRAVREPVWYMRVRLREIHHRLIAVRFQKGVNSSPSFMQAGHGLKFPAQNTFFARGISSPIKTQPPLWWVGQFYLSY